MLLFVLRKLILQTRMRSHPVGLDVWFLVGPFIYFHTWYVRTAKAVARPCGCAGSPEPSLVAYVISTMISWAGSYIAAIILNLEQFGHRLPFKEVSNNAGRIANRTDPDQTGPGHAKMWLMPYANSKGADQPPHPRSLISTFVVRCLDSMICILAISKGSRL